MLGLFRPTLAVICTDIELLRQLESSLKAIKDQSRVPSIRLVDKVEDAVPGAVLTQSVNELCTVHMVVPEDNETSNRIATEISRLEKRASKAEKALSGLLQRRNDPSYRAKVPEAVQAQDEARQNQLETDLSAAEKSLDVLWQLQSHYKSRA